MSTETEQSRTTGARAAVMGHAQRIAGAVPFPALRSLICPFCGGATPDTGRCQHCQARFDPLSRQATQNQMGPWMIRDEHAPYRPGCTYETLMRLIEQGVVRADTVLRGPTTRQFWTLARHTPSVSQLLGVCHNCQHEVGKDSVLCPSCQASFSPERDRQHMGIGPSRPLPGQGDPRALARQKESIGPAVSVQTPDGPATLNTERAALTEDAASVIRQWRSAFDAERKRAWIAVGLAGFVTLLALVFGMVGPRSG